MIEFKGTDEAVAKLLQAIGKARVKFNGLLKDANGQVGHTKFKYMPLATIVAAIEGPLNDEGVSFIQPMTGDVEWFAINTIFSGHGAYVSTFIRAPRPANIQEFGKVSTYQRRYALQSFLVLEGEDADDAQQSERVIKGATAEIAKALAPVVEKKPDSYGLAKSEPKAARELTDEINSQPQGVREMAMAIASGAKVVMPTENGEDLKNAIVEERKRLQWDSVRLSNEAFRMFKVHLPQTNDEQRRELLNKMKGMQPDEKQANPL